MLLDNEYFRPCLEWRQKLRGIAFIVNISWNASQVPCSGSVILWAP